VINYPLKFDPIYVPKIWGGNRLQKGLKKKNATQSIGESWEISGVNDHVSCIANGPHSGMCLDELIKIHKGRLVGESVYDKYQNKFPILIKFLDANTDLSIQLHPDDQLAKKRHNSSGKTEMWYIVQAEKDARIIAGFNKDTTKDDYLSAMENNQLIHLLQEIPVQKGDAFFIAPGIVHTIGAGIVLAEIQQTSDITYRLYDWDRKDEFGNQRELHTEQALEAINFKKGENIQLNYASTDNQSNEIKTCPYFTTNYLPINKQLQKDISQVDSFLIYICIGGKAEFSINNKSETIKAGETVLIPAVCDNVIISAEKAELLEVHM